MKKTDKSLSNAVRVKQVISVDNLSEILPYPLYEEIAEGVIKENPGVRRKNKVLLYDVTNADEAFKEAHSDIIEEYPVKEIIKIQRPAQKQPARQNGKIISMLPISSDSYMGLNKSEQKSLGYNYVMIELTSNGIKIKPVITIHGDIPEELYILISKSIAPEILDKIGSDTIELISLPNGLYKQQGNLGLEDLEHKI